MKTKFLCKHLNIPYVRNNSSSLILIYIYEQKFFKLDKYIIIRRKEREKIIFLT